MRISKESVAHGPRDDGGEVPIVMAVAQGTKATVEKRHKKGAFYSRVIPKKHNLSSFFFSRTRRTNTKHNNNTSVSASPTSSISASSSSSLKSTPSQISHVSSASSGYVGEQQRTNNCIHININRNMARAAPDLTEETMKEFREAFALFDLNNDGVISVEELGIFIGKMGANSNNNTNSTTEADLSRMIAEVDADGDGAIDFPEFVTLMARKMNNVDKDSEIREAFNVYDKDGSGKISRKELLHLMSKFHKDVSEDDIEQMIKEADTNGDGEIEFEEFKRMLS